MRLVFTVQLKRVDHRDVETRCSERLVRRILSRPFQYRCRKMCPKSSGDHDILRVCVSVHGIMVW